MPNKNTIVSNAIRANVRKSLNADAPELAAVKRNCRAKAYKIVSAINELAGTAEGFLDMLPPDFKRYYESVVNFRLEVERLMAACR